MPFIVIIIGYNLQQSSAQRSLLRNVVLANYTTLVRQYCIGLVSSLPSLPFCSKVAGIALKYSYLKKILYTHWTSLVYCNIHHHHLSLKTPTAGYRHSPRFFKTTGTEILHKLRNIRLSRPFIFEESKVWDFIFLPDAALFITNGYFISIIF